jgi:flagellar hook assembly protein FlgD
LLYTRGNVKAEIFNNRGQKVSSLLNEEQTAGEHRIHWQAVDEHGKSLPSGIYLARFQFNNTIETRKVMLIK